MIAHCDYYQTLPPPDSKSSCTYTIGLGCADTTTYTTTWNDNDGWYTSTTIPIQEEPVIVKKQNRNIFDDRKNIYRIEKPIVNNIPRKRIHNRFGRVCVT